jgi:hypothetical protein
MGNPTELLYEVALILSLSKDEGGPRCERLSTST